jgi:hypothetical protein
VDVLCTTPILTPAAALSAPGCHSLTADLHQCTLLITDVPLVCVFGSTSDACVAAPPSRPCCDAAVEVNKRCHSVPVAGNLYCLLHGAGWPGGGAARFGQCLVPRDASDLTIGDVQGPAEAAQGEHTSLTVCTQLQACTAGNVCTLEHKACKLCCLLATIQQLAQAHKCKLLHSACCSSVGMAEPPEPCAISMQAQAAEVAAQQAVKRASQKRDDANDSYSAAAVYYSKAVWDHKRCAAAPASPQVRFVWFHTVPLSNIFASCC